jgi:hypothetical protein
MLSSGEAPAKGARLVRIEPEEARQATRLASGGGGGALGAHPLLVSASLRSGGMLERGDEPIAGPRPYQYSS